MNSTPKKCYWDACTWIALITQESPERAARCEYVIEQSEHGAVALVTSAFTLAEVYKRKCYKEYASLPEVNDAEFEQFVYERVGIIQVTYEVGVMARRLLRKHPNIGKPQDAVHVASCLVNNICELHTFDHKNLIPFNGRLECKNKNRLTICEPPNRPVVTQGPPVPTLFD